MNMPATLQADNLTKQFIHHGQQIKVLNNLNYIFTQGITYAITGKSGSGKSTLLQLLAGIDTPTTGEILFNNQQLHQFSSQQRSHFLTHEIGLVFQQPYLLKELSVIENIMLKGHIAGIEKQQCLERAHELLKIFNLHEKTDSMPATLSGGQQQRIALMRAIFIQPKFLLLDEPTGSLDEKTSLEIIDFLAKCQQDLGMGMIIASHDPHVAQRMQMVLNLQHGILI